MSRFTRQQTSCARHRLRRWVRVVPAIAPVGFPVGACALLRTALAFGMVCGWLELGVMHAQHLITGEITLDTLHTNRNYVWMILLSNGLVFGLLGGLASVAFRAFRLGPVFTRFLIHFYVFLVAAALVLLFPRMHWLAQFTVAMGAARWLGSHVVNRAQLFARLSRQGLPALACATLGLGLIDWYETVRSEEHAIAALPKPSQSAPNVLLIVLDTVRADALNNYGRHRNVTPNLAHFAKTAVQFNEARSTAPWTLTSHCSMFTGRWPHELSANVARPLDATQPTLAEFLESKGYATAGFAANMNNCNFWYGLARGFARYEDFYEAREVSAFQILRSSRLGRILVTCKLGRSLYALAWGEREHTYRKTAEMVNSDALKWLERRRDRPSFVFLNYFDAHDPYQPPNGAAETFSKTAQSRSVAEAARNSYDDCLHYLDSQIGKLLDALDRRGLSENTLVIITADHGEGFGEHGLSGHGISLYRTELRVPLLIRYPGKTPEGYSFDSPVSLRSIPATVLDLLGFRTESPFPGKSLADAWSKTEPKSSWELEPVLAEVDRAGKLVNEMPDVPASRGKMRSLTDPHYVYIRNGDGEEELYDHQTDPDELHNLANDPNAKDVISTLRKRLEDETAL